MPKSTITVTVPRGLAAFCADEIRALGLPVTWAGSSGVKTAGTFTDAMRLNLHLRTGHRVLFLLREFPCRNADDLYAGVSKIAWEGIIPADGYLSVVSHAVNETIKDTRFVNLRCKDAIVDRIKARKGRRPDAGSDQSGTVVNCYWHRQHCEVYLDTSGEPLSRRGYRKIPLGAPMQETLAAGILIAAGWRGEGAFINPMCGSGTLAIEAALIAANRAPGLVRPSFGFMHTMLFDRAGWSELRAEASSVVSKSTASIVAADISQAAIEAARKSAKTAGVEQLITFTQADVEDTPVPEGPGIVMVNPEYGLRMGAGKDLVREYRAIGRFFKNRCAGYRGYVFSGNGKLVGQVGLKAGKRLAFLNGNIECRLYEYALYPKRPMKDYRQT